MQLCIYTLVLNTYLEQRRKKFKALTTTCITIKQNLPVTTHVFLICFSANKSHNGNNVRHRMV